jgi:putative copper resistance protein D
MIDTLSIILRALGFIALFQAAGMAMFIGLFHRKLGSPAASSIRRHAVAATVAGAGLVSVHFALEPARMGGALASIRDPFLWDLVLHSPLGAAYLWRLSGLALLLVGLLRGTPAGRFATLAGVAIMLFAFTQVGHTSVFAPRPLLALLVFIHTAVVAFWFGALLPLYLIAQHETAPEAGKLVESFSRMALWWVPGIFVTGLGLASLLLGSWEAVLSPYGRMVLLKAALFATLMVLAALNRWRYGPALATGNPMTLTAFKWTLRAEFILISAVLAVTAALTTLYSPES